MSTKNNCLTPWDVQSRQIYSDDGPWMTLYAGQGGGRGYMIMNYWTCQGISQFIQCNAASNLMARDYKDGRDLIQEDRQMEGQGKKYILRRLTPMECARLQGFPDWWCDGVEGSDSAQYKLWGNGIALPCACDILGRIAEEARLGGENE